MEREAGGAKKASVKRRIGIIIKFFLSSEIFFVNLVYFINSPDLNENRKKILFLSISNCFSFCRNLILFIRML